MTRSHRLGFALAALLTIAVAAPQARAAEPSAADAETALRLFKDGKTLRDNGDTPGALAKFRAAYALAETPITALELGRTYAMLGKLVEAREILLAVARIPARKNESQKSIDSRQEADALAAAMQPRLASLTVHVKGAPQSPPKISVDGVPVPPDAASQPRVVNPGRHVVVLDVNGRTAQAEVTVEEGKTRDVELEAPAGPAPPPSPPPPPPVAISSEPPAGHATSPLVYVGFGTAAAGLAVGTIAGLVTLSKAGSLKDVCRNGRCPPSAQSDLDSSSTTGAIATVGFVVAGVGIGVGVAGLFLGKSEPPPATTTAPSARLFVSPTGGGVRGTF